MFNLYDFDKTIYDGDSSIDFFLFLLTKRWKIIKYFPKIILSFFKYKAKIISKDNMKEKFFSILYEIDDIDKYVKLFWKSHNKKIKKWYLYGNHNKDIIISASPEFLIKPIGIKLKVKDVIATKVDKHTGIFDGKNCYGEEKVKRLYEKYNNITINNAYSDSYSDMPMLNLAKNKFIVKKNKIIKI